MLPTRQSCLHHDFLLLFKSESQENGEEGRGKKEKGEGKRKRRGRWRRNGKGRGKKGKEMWLTCVSVSEGGFTHLDPG